MRDLVALREADAALREGNALRSAGRLPESIAAYRKATLLHPAGGAGHFNLGVALREAGDRRGAALAFRCAARCDPRDFAAVQNVVDNIASAVASGAAPLFPRARGERAQGGTPVSIVTCSIHPRKLAAMRENFRAALGARGHEWIAITDAKSLSEGYMRGLAQARHPMVVFAHDDVELVSPHPFEALDDALESNDVVGLAGAALASGPAVMWAGHPHMRGWVAYPADEGAWDATVFSLEGGIQRGMQTLDGMLIAARREAAEKLGFDAAAFDGFHFYDLDFAYRAHAAGLAVAVTTDVTAIHASRGSFGADWKRYAERFMAKFPKLASPKGEHHAYRARLATRAQVLRFYEELRGLAAIA